MRPTWILLMTTVCMAHGGHLPLALWQFAEMITCVQPDINPLVYNNYGCYCGLGGQGSPKDPLDDCCYVHDMCYNKARTPCNGNLPHLSRYEFTCSGQDNICSGSNDKCQAAVCDCDRVAAGCFARHQSTYNPEYKNLDKQKECQ